MKKVLLNMMLFAFLALIPVSIPVSAQAEEVIAANSSTQVEQSKDLAWWGWGWRRPYWGGYWRGTYGYGYGCNDCGYGYRGYGYGCNDCGYGYRGYGYGCNDCGYGYSGYGYRGFYRY